MQVCLLSLGATVHSVIYPGEGAEEARDVVMGFDKVSKIILNMPQCPPCYIHPIQVFLKASGYEGKENPFFWGTTGRMTNR